MACPAYQVSPEDAAYAEALKGRGLARKASCLAGSEGARAWGAEGPEGLRVPAGGPDLSFMGDMGPVTLRGK